MARLTPNAPAHQPAAVARPGALHIAWALALQPPPVAWAAAAAVALALTATVALLHDAMLEPAAATQSAAASVQSAAAATGQALQPNH